MESFFEYTESLFSGASIFNEVCCAFFLQVMKDFVKESRMR